MAIRWVVDPQVTGEENLRRDEGLLAAGSPAVRVSRLGDRSASFGVGQGVHPPGWPRAAELGIPAVRRQSGGTGLLHLPGDVAWSVVLPRTETSVGRGFVRAYGRFGAGVVDFLAGRGVPARWVPAPGLREQYCLLSGRGKVLDVDGRIAGGAAQHATAAALLHHGILPGRVDSELLEALFGVERTLAARRLVGLEELLGGPPDDRALRALAEAIAQAVD